MKAELEDIFRERLQRVRQYETWRPSDWEDTKREYLYNPDTTEMEDVIAEIALEDGADIVLKALIKRADKYTGYSSEAGGWEVFIPKAKPIMKTVDQMLKEIQEEGNENLSFV